MVNGESHRWPIAAPVHHLPFTIYHLLEPTRYAVECIEECQKADGTTCRVGDIIIDPLAWMLCLHGFRNAAPRFKPSDADTAAKVAAATGEQQPIVDATRAYLQTKINEIAASGKLPIDPATGFFQRDEDGGFGKLPKLAVHIIETAFGHGLRPATQNLKSEISDSKSVDTTGVDFAVRMTQPVVAERVVAEVVAAETAAEPVAEPVATVVETVAAE